MKKRKPARSIPRRIADVFEPEEEQDMAEEVVEQEVTPAPLIFDHAQPAREVGSAGLVAVRGVIDKTVPSGVDVIIARLPADAFVFAGGVWVSEPFDPAGEVEIGHGGDFNTFVSVPLGTVGFTEISLKPEGVPVPHVLELRARVEGGPFETGKASFVIVYA
jgi:hypothetical protein